VLPRLLCITSPVTHPTRQTHPSPAPALQLPIQALQRSPRSHAEPSAPCPRLLLRHSTHVAHHSTKILQFSMRHHCGCTIVIQTDPKNAEYLVVEGARKKVRAGNPQPAPHPPSTLRSGSHDGTAKRCCSGPCPAPQQRLCPRAAVRVRGGPVRLHTC
jgi:hypothetical protein